MHKYQFCGLIVSLFLALFGPAQKFVPENGKCLVFVGQDLEATGGLDNYNEGYSDFFKVPAGITAYTNLSPGNSSFGYTNKGLDGLRTKANWGAGDSCLELYIHDSTYKHSILAIGLSFVNNEKKVANGNHDNLINELASWIKSIKRPVFLRIGYEFDGWEWNGYKKRHYLRAWNRIHSIFMENQVDNVAFVWQSKGNGSNQKVLEQWYPGDAIVDWCAYSYFGQADQQMITFARKHKKPVFIAEATPVRQNGNLYFNTDLEDKQLDETIWKEWFLPFFNTIETNSDVVKAFSYINSDWSSQPMWMTNPVLKKVDSRLQKSEYISRNWKEKMDEERYLHASKDLIKKLN
ncbi:MAG: 1,4-beta-xylanase [Bacteroidota bacterium]